MICFLQIEKKIRLFYCLLWDWFFFKKKKLKYIIWLSRELKLQLKSSYYVI